MAVLEGAVNTTITGGTFIAGGSSAEGGLKFSASDDIVDILLSRSSIAGLLNAEERFNASKCDEGTRVSMLREMTKFVQQGGQASMFWLHGPAGVGKSALAQSLALSLEEEGDHAASFFFSRTSPGRNDGNQLIVTLAYQLAISFPALQPFVLKAFKKNPAVLTASNAVKMQSLIVEPINRWQKKYRRGIRRWAHKLLNPDTKRHPRLILVDGLDECRDPQVQQDLIICIGHAVQRLTLPFRFVIASRPESQILATFELDPIFQGPHGVKLSTRNLGEDENADQQITTFLLKEFAEIRRTHPIRKFLPQPWPLPNQIAQLVSKSSRGFIYPATVIRYIKLQDNRPDECLERILGLSEIPIGDKPYEPLDVLYRHIFESVPDVHKEAVRSIFHFLVIPHDVDGLIPLTPRLVEKYFDYKPGHVEHVLRNLHCLVAFTGDDSGHSFTGDNTGLIKVLHDSLPDFLLDRSRSGPLCIGIGDAHATIAGAFPLALSTIHSSYLPQGFAFVKLLQHTMQANLSNPLVLSKLVDVDFSFRYRKLSQICLGEGIEPARTLDEFDLDGIAFVAAYLLVLVIKNVDQMDVRRHITEINTYIFQKYPFAACLHAMRSGLVPAMIPLFQKWASSTTDHQYVKYIFACEVSPSQWEIREEIFEMYLLMMTPFWGLTARDKTYSQNMHHQFYPPQVPNDPNYICLTLLAFSLCEHDWSQSIESLKLLAADLLGVSLAYADYSASIMTLLGDLLDRRPGFGRDMQEYLRRVAPSVTDYVKRVSSDAPADCQQEILELTNAWDKYANQQNIDSEPSGLHDCQQSVDLS